MDFYSLCCYIHWKHYPIFLLSKYKHRIKKSESKKELNKEDPGIDGISSEKKSTNTNEEKKQSGTSADDPIVLSD